MQALGVHQIGYVPNWNIGHLILPFAYELAYERS